jgi:hypothetical protein
MNNKKAYHCDCYVGFFGADCAQGLLFFFVGRIISRTGGVGNWSHHFFADNIRVFISALGDTEARDFNDI